MLNRSDRALFSPADILITAVPGKNVLEGEIFCGYPRKKIGYTGEWELLSAISGWCDWSHYPEAMTTLRSFSVRKHRKRQVRKAVTVLDSKLKNALEGKSTFLVHIQFRRNATWQGTITWLEAEKTQNFRSAFEMLKLMEEADHPGIEKCISWDAAGEEKKDP